MSQLFKSGGQSIGASASASVLLMNIQDWSPLGWTGLIKRSLWTEKGQRIRVKAEVTELNPKLKVVSISTVWDGHTPAVTCTTTWVLHPQPCWHVSWLQVLRCCWFNCPHTTRVPGSLVSGIAYEYQVHRGSNFYLNARSPCFSFIIA